jgi:hypothetical protein
MTVTLIGSQAMRIAFPDSREPKDWDYHSPKPIRPELLLGDCFDDERLGAWPWGAIATPDELYTLKISHSFWEINGSREWNKHAADIVFLSRKGAQFLRPLYDIVLPIWKERYARKLTSLNQNKEAFFADAVDRKYDHDSIHRSIAYGERPLYESVLKEGSDVAVDNSKFWAMDFETQLKLVREEIYTTALERKLIPGNYQGSPGVAYNWALRRTATSLFKGEWALFLILNLDRLMRPDCNYLQRHLDNQHLLIQNGENNV